MVDVVGEVLETGWRIPAVQVGHLLLETLLLLLGGGREIAFGDADALGQLGDRLLPLRRRRLRNPPTATIWITPPLARSICNCSSLKLRGWD